MSTIPARLAARERTPGLLSLGDVRDAAGAVLAPLTDDEPPVIVDYVDALYPPALMLLWGDPWIEPGVEQSRQTFGPCELRANLTVRCVAGRLEPGSGIRVLESLVVHVVTRLALDAYSWPLIGVTGPRRFDMDNTYLGTDVRYAVPATL